LIDWIFASSKTMALVKDGEGAAQKKEQQHLIKIVKLLS
jgi:hypothetical protein